MRFDVHNLLVGDICLLKFTCIEKVNFWWCKKLLRGKIREAHKKILLWQDGMT